MAGDVPPVIAEARKLLAARLLELQAEYEEYKEARRILDLLDRPASPDRDSAA